MSFLHTFGRLLVLQFLLISSACLATSFPEEDRDLTTTTERELLNGEWQACSGVTGTCIDTSRYHCSGGTLTGRCPGPSQVRCCPSPQGVVAAACNNGVCMRTSNCPQTTQTGKCPGPWSVTCCPSSPPPPPPKTWICCRVECAGFSMGPFGVCASTFYDAYGPTRPHGNCIEKPSPSSGAAHPGCCAWHQPFCV